MTRPSYPRFGQGASGGTPADWWGTAAVDGDRPPWLRAPAGARYQSRLTANQTEWYEKVKSDGRDDDWVLKEGVICQRILKADFTDVTTTGTKVLNGIIPVGAYLEIAHADNVVAFSGDTSATINISGGVDVITDVDGYMTGNPSLFGVTGTAVLGVPSGVRTVTTAGAPVVVVTTTADFTNVNALAAVTITLFYKR